MHLFNFRFAFPVILFVWFLYIVLADSYPTSLRGGNHSAGDSASVNGGSTLRFQLEEENPLTRVNHLIVVAGHAVMRISNLKNADKADNSWYLLSYQQNQGFPSIITSHIQKGVDLLKHDPDSLLIFSGGQTRRDVGPLSEAASYYFLSSEKNWIKDMADRVYLEEYARDSFENLLFSICRYREIVGQYPAKISVVGFDFKGTRFTSLHRKAIGFPAQNFTYVGVRSAHPNFNQERAEKGELGALESFQKDLYGCNDPSLYSKREQRNPFRRTIPYSLACPEMGELLKWCGPGYFDLKTLPWSKPNAAYPV